MRPHARPHLADGVDAGLPHLVEPVDRENARPQLVPVERALLDRRPEVPLRPGRDVDPGLEVLRGLHQIRVVVRRLGHGEGRHLVEDQIDGLGVDAVGGDRSKGDLQVRRVLDRHVPDRGLRHPLVLAQALGPVLLLLVAGGEGVLDLLGEPAGEAVGPLPVDPELPRILAVGARGMDGEMPHQPDSKAERT